MIKRTIFVLLAAVFVSFLAVGNGNSVPRSCHLLKAEDFQKSINGKQTGLYFLKNGKIEAAITNYGARIVSLNAPDKNGNYADVVLGFKSIDDYLNAKGIYHGAIVGRVAGRVENSSIDVDGKIYELQANASPNQLHGGVGGFHNQVWDVREVTDTSIVLSYFSVDGEMGYPGNLNVSVSYSLNSNNELSMELNATTDKTTPLNLTNHAFFNLAGEGSGTVLNHILTIPSKHICKINENKIISTKLMKVKSTPFDFRKPKAIGSNLMYEKANEQLKIAGGYDHRYVLSRSKNSTVKLAATVLEPVSGRKMEVLSNEPCIHLFTANFFNGSDIGKTGNAINFRESVALEMQRFPYDVNSKSSKSILLKPGENYLAKTILRFSAELD